MLAFPHLNADTVFKKTSDKTSNYNCIAFAAGVESINWWPPLKSGVVVPDWYWPPWAPNEVTVDAFIQAFEGLGYRTCADGARVPGVEKVAIYADPATDEPTHAALQTKDGLWKSKLGPFIDVRHATVTGVEGDRYGQIAVYMERGQKRARSWVAFFDRLRSRARWAVSRWRIMRR